MDLWKFGELGSWSYRVFDCLRNRLNARLADYLYGYISHRNGIFVIEAGSGPGFCASILNKKNKMASVNILDVDPEVVQLAELRDCTINAIKGSIYDIPFPDNYFDLVYNSSTLEHLDDYKEAFLEMVRVCKSGGYVFVGIPESYGPLVLFRLFPPSGKICRWIGKFISRNEIRGWTKDSPVELIDEISYFYRFFKGFLFQKRPI